MTQTAIHAEINEIRAARLIVVRMISLPRQAAPRCYAVEQIWQTKKTAGIAPGGSLTLLQMKT